jgi:hypothetical protein
MISPMVSASFRAGTTMVVLARVVRILLIVPSDLRWLKGRKTPKKALT